MQLDANLKLSSDQALTASAASTNVIDLGANAGFERSDLRIVGNVSTTFSGGTSVAFKIQTDSDSAFGSAVDIYTGSAIPVATLVEGYVPVDIPFPAGAKRYLRGYYTVVGSPSAGKVNLELSSGTPTLTSYADAVDTF